MKAGWKLREIGEAFQTVTGNTPPKSAKHYYGHDVPLVKPPELTDGDVDSASDGLSDSGAQVARVAPEGSVLVSCIGNLGKIGLATRPVAFNQQINAIYPDPTLALPRFTFYQTLSPQFREQLDALAAGTTVSIVNKSRFNSIKVPLPPLEEQQRIVAVLDEAFEGLARASAHAEANLQNARELLDETEAKLFRDVSLGSSETTLGQLASFRNGLNYSRTSRGAEVKVVGVGDFQANFKVPTETISFTKIDGQLGDNDRLIAGDILAVRSNGNPELIGRTMLMPPVDEPISFSGFSIRIRLTTSNVLPEYVCSYMRTKTARAQLTAGGGGANISNLNQRILSSFPIYFPDINGQRSALERLEALRQKTFALREIYSEKLQDIDDLRQSLLQKAFAGELT